MSFMTEIDEARPAPIDQLAVDFVRSFLARRSPTLDFCRQVAVVSDSDPAIARRLGVSVEAVRGWREVGRR